MRVTVTVIGAVTILAATLSACGSGSKHPSNPGTAGSTASASRAVSSTATSAPAPSGGSAANAALCADIATVTNTQASIANQLSNPDALKNAVMAAGPLLQKLQNDAAAVPDVRAAVDDLSKQFTAVQAALNSNPPSTTALATAAVSAESDAAQLASYARTHCSGAGASS